MSIYIARLEAYRAELQGTLQEISEENLRGHIYSTCPLKFKPIVTVLKRTPDMGQGQGRGPERGQRRGRDGGERMSDGGIRVDAQPSSLAPDQSASETALVSDTPVPNISASANITSTSRPTPPRTPASTARCPSSVAENTTHGRTTSRISLQWRGPSKLSLVRSLHPQATGRQRLETSPNGRSNPSDSSGHQWNTTFEPFPIVLDIATRA